MKLLATTIVSSSVLASGFSPVEQAPSSNNAQIVERLGETVRSPPLKDQPKTLQVPSASTPSSTRSIRHGWQ